MADFNQNPLGQTSLAAAAITLTLGSAADTAAISTDTTSYATDGSVNGPTYYQRFSPVRPAWRRESKIIKANN
jgi:hypothetical protein